MGIGREHWRCLGASPGMIRVSIGMRRILGF